MSNQKTSEASRSATSSPASQDGLSPCSSQDYPTTSRAGRVVLRASLSAWLDQEAGKTIHVTWLRPFSISSQSVVLQCYLASRLRPLSKKTTGLMLYSSSWKRKATPAGRMYYQLAVSALRTNATEYFSAQRPWATASYSDGRRGGSGITEGMTGVSLAQQAKMANWSTPRLGGGNESVENWLSRKQAEYEKYPGKGIGSPDVSLQAQLASWHTAIANDAKGSNYSTSNGQVILKLGGEAKLANWPTSSATDGKGGYQGGRIRNGKLSVDRLDVAAQLVTPDFPIRITADGRVLTGSSAGMSVSGPLNPEHSRWLMGYGAAWGYSKDMVTPSYRKQLPGLLVDLSSQLMRLAEAIFRNRLARGEK